MSGNVVTFPKQSARDVYVEQLRHALWLIAGDLQALKNSGEPLMPSEEANLEFARSLLGDWKPRELRE